MEAEEQLRTPLPLPCMFNCMSMQTEEQKKQGRLENEDINSQMSSCCRPHLKYSHVIDSEVSDSLRVTSVTLSDLILLLSFMHAILYV